MTEKPALFAAGTKVRHKTWPQGVFGTITAMDQRQFALDIGDAGGPLEMLADFEVMPG